MSVLIQHFWTADNVFQAGGTTQEWLWPVGEGESYFGYSVRPFQLNSGVEVLRQWTTSDNNEHWTEHFSVKMSSSGLIRISAIAAKGA
jgi:hypothetical protein